jgi:hypothetical protein
MSGAPSKNTGKSQPAKGAKPKSRASKPNNNKPKPKVVYSPAMSALIDLKFCDVALLPDTKVVPAPVGAPTDPLAIGFGHVDVKQPQDLYMRSGRGSTGSVTTKTELGLIVTDFFDYNVFDISGVQQQVTNYFWSVDQNLFQNGESSDPYDDRERTFCRVRKVEVFVLPAKGFEIGAGTGPNETNSTGMFTVNCQTPGVSSVNSQAAIAMDTQVTNVLPQIDTFWKRVFKCDLQKTFQSGVVKPYFDTVVDAAAQCIFQMCIVDPTDGSAYLPSNTERPVFSIRTKVVLHIDQPIATIQNAKLKVFRNESFITPSLNQNGPAFSDLEEEYVQVNLKRAQDNMR